MAALPDPYEPYGEPAGDAARPRDAGPGVIATQRLRISGVEQRLLTAGSGWPLVLLHGIAGSADEWTCVMPHLAERFHVLAADAPGHGFSEKPASHRYDLAYYVVSMLAVMDAAGIRRAPLAALSGGGTVALTLALEHPERVSKLVLVDAAGLGREVSWEFRLATLPLLRHVFRHTISRRSVAAYARTLCYDPDRVPEGWIDRRLEVWRSEGVFEAFFRTVQTGLNPLGQRAEYSRRLGEIHQPALIVWGRQDPVLPVSHGIRAAQRMPNARLHIFEKCGHMPVWEYPAALARLMIDFLA